MIWLVGLGLAGMGYGQSVGWRPMVCPSQPTAGQRQQALQWRQQYERFVRSRRISGGPDASPDGVRYLPIRLHIVRADDGSGGVSLETINQALANTNRLYRPAGVQFYLATQGQAGDPNYATDFINDSRFVTFTPKAVFEAGPDAGKLHEFALVDTTSRRFARNAINVYFTQQILYSGHSIGGYANFPGPYLKDNYLFVVNNQVNDNVTLPHELGHYFNLYHTFQDNHEEGNRRELVTRNPREAPPRQPANCALAGDQLCDTPADPYGLDAAPYQVGCSDPFAGIKAPQDANGDAFSPGILLRNLMSYWNYTCLDSFTGQQLERITQAVYLRTDRANAYQLDAPARLFPESESPAALTAHFTGTRVSLEWRDNSQAETGYQIERSALPTGPFVPIGGVGPNQASYLDGSIRPDETYYYRVRPSNAEAAYTAVVPVTTGRVYCQPAYARSVSPSDSRCIRRLTLTDEAQTLLDNPSDGNSPAFFGDFTPLQTGPTARLPGAQLRAGRLYTLTLTVASTAVSSPIFDLQPKFGVWIDLNRDAVFSPEERLQAGQFGKDRLSVTVSLVIPLTVSPGRTRLRVRFVDEQSEVLDACEQRTQQETEDYLVDLQAAPTDAPQAFTADWQVPTPPRMVRSPDDFRPAPPLQVIVVGNPVRDNQLTLDILGASGRTLQITVTDGRGLRVAERLVRWPGTTERQTFSLPAQAAGILLVTVTTPQEQQVIRCLQD